MPPSPEFAFPLDDRVILVTGGASGIGLATVRMALAGGAKVVAVDVNQEALSTLRGSAGPASDRLMAEAMDVTDAGAIAATLAKARDVFGVVDGLVCSAGVSIESPLLDVTPELWRRHIDLNLTSTFSIAQAVARDLVATGKTGSIVTISSGQGYVGWKNSAPYVASKAGVFGLTKALAIDLAANGVRVNCVAPGAVETPLLQRIIDGAEDPARLRAGLAMVPLGRTGQPQDVAAPVCFLLSDAAGWMTGQTLHVNGGAILV